MEKITITRALAELKLLDSRIRKEIANSKFIDVAQQKIENGHRTLRTKMSKDEFEKKAKADYQSIIDLINRRNRIKSAILKSNAETKVRIGGKEYTVAEVIDQKNAIYYKKQLLDSMRYDLKVVLDDIEQNRMKTEAQIETILSQSFGSGKKATQEEYNTIAKPIIEANELKFVDPLKLQEKIDALDKEIDEFESEVDFVLSESNSRTEIEI